MKAIYRLHFDCGRQGTLSGIFVAEKANVEELVASGESIDFGEALGKHSDIQGPLDEGDFTMISDKLEDVEVVERLNLTTGYDPVSTYRENHADD